MTEQEKQEIKQEVLNAIKSESQGVTELEEVSSLDGVKTLPALRGTELVSAPVSLLGKPATDAAAQALAAKAAAEGAASTATTAAGNADAKAQAAQTAAQAATDAKEATEQATQAAEAVAEQYEGVAVLARNGATARFADILDDVTLAEQSFTSVDAIYYVTAKKLFVGKNGTRYSMSWKGCEMYNDLAADPIGIRKDKLYLQGDTLYAWSDEEDALVEASGTGGGNTINVTETYPLEGSFYTLATAIRAVEEKKRVKGACVTFEVSQGKWQTKQFVGTSLNSWESESSWDDFGGGGTVKSVTLNGQKVTPDAQGNIGLTVNEVEVDSSLDVTSTNPVENRAVATKISEIEAGTVFDMDAELSQDESTVTLSLKNKSGAEIASVDIPAGSGGGGGGEAATSRIVLGASVSQPIVKEGGACMLTWSYDHQYVGGDDAGESTGQKATVEIRVMRGSIQAYREEKTEVSAGTYTLDVSKFLQVGTTDIYVKATTTDPTTGNTQTKQAYVSVRVVNLSLSSSYSLSSGMSSGGYSQGDSVVIPYTVQGTGTKTVFLYVDGVQSGSATVTRSGTTNGSFTVAMSGLSVGRHTVQLVAEMEASQTLTLRSESIYIDIFKAGSSAPLIGTKHTFKDGRIFTASNHLTPRLEVGQYEQLQFEYCVYDAGVTPAAMSVWQNGSVVQTVSVPRSTQTYANRFTQQGAQTMKLVSGATEYPFYIDVTQSSLDVEEATLDLRLKLTAAGRSNGESDPAHWEHGGVTTSFENVDWNTSGWTGESLKLMNGAKATIDFKPFTQDAATLGRTIEVELKVSNITDKEADVVSCMDGTKGFQITADKAMMYTGSTKEVEDEDGNTIEQPVGVGRQYGEGEWKKIAFVVGRRADGRLMELYVNGTRCAADIYGDSDNFLQDTPRGITISSAGADVEVRTVRVYDRALSDDEEMDNHIVDRTTVDEMAALFEENDVLGEDGHSIDFQKLRNKGKGIMLVVRQGGLDPVNAENNKKTDFLADVHLWLQDGRYIYLHNVYIRIQGTSSTKYPTKNYRVYCAKGESPEMYVNGVKQTELKIALRVGQKKVKILCAKADYSDSSMAQNTGGAKLWNNLMKSLGFLTPPQQVDSNVRTAVDGFPIDVFSAESLEDTPTYYGQYNLNHDKSDWQAIIGMEGVDGFTPTEPIAFEFLNNTQPLCLFQGQSDLDAQAAAEFDNALEFNYPAKTGGEDTKWANAPTSKKNAFKRLWGWIRDCMPAGATPSDVSTFVSSKFKTEASQYLNLNFLLCWWLFTDYFANVDQRAKNMIASTWDALVWYLLYYDGDTQLGDRNDSMLAYLYNVTRETWDSDKSKYAFEGHDSWLWCLVLANFESELKAMATTMRAKLTEELVNQMFDEEQQGNWCGRAYNKSGEIKYIKPQTEGVPTKNGIVKYPYIYALKGDKQAFRHWFVRNRFAMLDARYGTGGYLSDNIDMYMSRQAADVANTVVVKSDELWYFGYGTNNVPFLQADLETRAGETATLVFESAFTVNDPIRIYGASRIAELDMRGAADNLTGDLNLNRCRVLRKLDISTSGNGSSGWCLVLGQCRGLTAINLKGQAGAKTGTMSSTELDFRNQTRLETLDARGVDVQAVLFARGCPLVSAKLGSRIETLGLEYLPELTPEGLSLEDWTTVRTLRFAGCPGMDWQELVARCPSVRRLRIEGINMEDDGTLLDRYRGYNGVDASGNAVDYCALVGEVRLTRYVEEDEYNALQQRYPELTLRNAPYTAVEFDDTTSREDNITNLDNRTGYGFGNGYEPSGHIMRIKNGIHVYDGRVEDGVMRIKQVSDTDYTKYADGTAFNAAAPAGDVFACIPRYWYKGVNDHFSEKKYLFLSTDDGAPRSGVIERGAASAYVERAGRGLLFQALTAGASVPEAAYSSSDSQTDVGRVGVAGAKTVRWPGFSSSSYCCAFLDADGRVLETVRPDFTGRITNDFRQGDYLFTSVPDGAAAFLFTMPRAAEGEVVTSEGTGPEAAEPDWAEHALELVGVYKGYLLNNIPRSISGVSPTVNNTDAGSWSGWRTDADGNPANDDISSASLKSVYDIIMAARHRGKGCGWGYHVTDYHTHKDLAVLYMAIYGVRDVQKLHGFPYGGISKMTGATDAACGTLGETEGTIGGQQQYTHTRYLGIEDWAGWIYEVMDGVAAGTGLSYSDWNRAGMAVPAVASTNGAFKISAMGADAERSVQSYYDRDTTGSQLDGVIARMRWGRHCDVIPSAASSRGFDSLYCDGWRWQAVYGPVMRAGIANTALYYGLFYLDTYKYEGTYLGRNCRNPGFRLCWRGGNISEV